MEVVEQASQTGLQNFRILASRYFQSFSCLNSPPQVFLLVVGGPVDAFLDENDLEKIIFCAVLQLSLHFKTEFFADLLLLALIDGEAVFDERADDFAGLRPRHRFAERAAGDKQSLQAWGNVSINFFFEEDIFSFSEIFIFIMLFPPPKIVFSF